MTKKHVVNQNLDTSHQPVNNSDTSSRKFPPELLKQKLKRDWKATFSILGIISVMLVAIGSLYFLYKPHTIIVNITDKTWSRSVEIQVCKSVRASGWSIPSGGRLQYEQYEIYSYDSVNPAFTGIPIYQKKYYYDIDDWFYDHKEIAYGHTDTPHDPEYALSDNERDGSKSEIYRLYMAAKNKKQYQYVLSEKEWNQYEIGDEVIITISAGVVIDIEKCQ